MARNAKLYKRTRAKRLNRRIKRANRANREEVQRVLDWLFNESIFTRVALHGNTKWRCSSLVKLTLLWVWSAFPQLTESFVDARQKAVNLGVECAVTTYQGLMKALLSATSKLMPVVQIRLHELMAQFGGKYMRVGRWCPIAIDGSKESAPRTMSNERAFRAPNYGQGKNAKNRKRKKPSGRKVKTKKVSKPTPLPPPQIWVTMMWHIGLSLPWCWKVASSQSSERDLVRDILNNAHFLESTLFVGDAGFVGYDFWKTMMDRKHHFLVRVGANVRLLRGFGQSKCKDGDLVWCWPQSAANANLPPLQLRLVKCTIGKNKKVWLLTSVVDENLLTKNEMIALYKQRWGVELQFRALKQTFSRRKLRCRNSERVSVEADWSILGMAAIELIALREQLNNAKVRPEKLSFSKALTAMRHCLNNIDGCHDVQCTLQEALQNAKIDDYQRKSSKAGRYHPTRKHPPSCGEPIILKASPEQLKQCRATCLQNAL